MLRMAGFFLLVLAVIPSANAAAQKTSNPEQRAARRFDSVRQQPGLLLAFLREMPKGGDLHNHLGGAIYAESLIDFAAQDGFCVDHTTSMLIAPPCDDACTRFASKPAIRMAIQTMFGVSVTDVRTLNVRSKESRPGGLGRGRSGRRSGWKKAFVTLKDGDAIPIFEG